MRNCWPFFFYYEVGEPQVLDLLLLISGIRLVLVKLKFGVAICANHLEY